MAISKDKKQALVADFSSALASARMTVAAKYDGTTVADLQQLRRDARTAGVTVKVIKNRLVRTAMQQTKGFEETDTALLTGQLLYAYSTEDEVAPAQVVDKFAKNVPTIELIAGFDKTGAVLATADVKALAGLPSKNQLIAEVVAQLLSPTNDVTNALSGNLHALLDGVADKATA
ncbi:MAG: 50S ribosomal protein L10 [Candidatus Saccharimonadales bacterium]